MQAFKCDKCGQFHTYPFPQIDIDTSINSAALVVQYYSPEITDDFNQIDLCEVCAVEFRKYLDSIKESKPRVHE